MQFSHDLLILFALYIADHRESLTGMNDLNVAKYSGISTSILLSYLRKLSGSTAFVNAISPSSNSENDLNGEAQRELDGSQNNRHRYSHEKPTLGIIEASALRAHIGHTKHKAERVHGQTTTLPFATPIRPSRHTTTARELSLAQNRNAVGANAGSTVGALKRRKSS